MFTATKKQQHYLKQLAALQFPGSIDNLSTRLPIYALEQQLPKEDTVKLDDAVIEGQDIEYSKFYDEDGCSYSSVSELVEVQLGLDDDDSIREYNEENPDLPYIPYEKLREMDKKDIPELLLSVVDEADYLTVNKDDMVATYPYPFSCDDGANTLLEVKDTDILTPVERLFLWTEYKNPNPIETKKK